MVSLNNSLSPTQRKTFPQSLMEVGLSKKRKFDEESSENGHIFEKSLFKTMPHLECPMPLEWQRCLDIKSGQIYFYNTRTHKRTPIDPRLKQEARSPSAGHMSLDLELNLPCGSTSAANLKNQTADNFTDLSNSSTTCNTLLNLNLNSNNTDGLSWLAFDEEQQEMVAAVCKKCHMLVMMCKSSPSCPNCKFMHPPMQTIPSVFKRRTLSLLC